MIAVLEHMAGRIQALTAQVNGQHRFGAGFFAPGLQTHLRAKLVALNRFPGQFEPTGERVLLGADAVFPVIA